MKAVEDFEDLLILLNRHGARYLIVGGLAFIFHARPRFTKDMDLWVEGEPRNLENVNRALAEFGSPYLMEMNAPDQVVQIGLPPNRIDLLMEVGPVEFDSAWGRRVKARYGEAEANWIHCDDLEAIKASIPDPRHQDDARILRKLRQKRESTSDSTSRSRD
jgi:hypothetical protein